MAYTAAQNINSWGDAFHFMTENYIRNVLKSKTFQDFQCDIILLQ